jgi:hypothetical protein
VKRAPRPRRDLAEEARLDALLSQTLAAADRQTAHNGDRSLEDARQGYGIAPRYSQRVPSPLALRNDQTLREHSPPRTWS